MLVTAALLADNPLIVNVICGVVSNYISSLSASPNIGTMRDFGSQAALARRSNPTV